MSAPLRVAMIGNGFMGAAHSQAWRVAPRFFDLDRVPEMAVIVGRDAQKNAHLADYWGWQEAATDWREVIARDDVDIVDIVTPGHTHAEIAVAALEAGKHVLCEKPLANSVNEAEVMAHAATRARESGAVAMVGFTYRRVPAATFARQLVHEGFVGKVRHVRAEYLQDWLADADAPLTWRLDKSKAGSGALGDIGAHAIDLAQFITGENLTSVSGSLETFVHERPIVGERQGLSGTALDERGQVTVDDCAMFMARMAGGGIGSFTATRFATGRKNALRIEISGDRGAIAFDLEDMNSLSLYDATAPADRRGFTKVLVTEAAHPYMAAWWPPGHMLGYEHAFSHQVRDFVSAIAAGVQPTPSFTDGWQVQRVLAAVERSAGTGSAWTDTAS